MCLCLSPATRCPGYRPCRTQPVPRGTGRLQPSRRLRGKDSRQQSHKLPSPGIGSPFNFCLSPLALEPLSLDPGLLSPESCPGFPLRSLRLCESTPHWPGPTAAHPNSHLDRPAECPYFMSGFLDAVRYRCAASACLGAPRPGPHRDGGIENVPRDLFGDPWSSVSSPASQVLHRPAPQPGGFVR